MAHIRLSSPHTSLEAINRRRDLDSSRQEVWQAWKRYRKQDSKSSSGGEEDGFSVVIVDLGDRVHVALGRGIIVFACLRLCSHVNGCS